MHGMGLYSAPEVVTSSINVDALLQKAYAEGRKDEKEDILEYIANELQFARGMAKGNGGNPRYDYYVDAFEMLLNDLTEEFKK